MEPHFLKRGGVLFFQNHETEKQNAKKIGAIPCFIIILDLNFVLGVELSKIGGSGNRRRAERMDNDE